MQLDFTPEQHALQTELRRYLGALMTPELEAELAATEAGGPLYKRALAKMGADGWLGIGWPKEHGGQGRGPIEQLIFSDEVQRAFFPLPLLSINTVGPTLMRHGTPEQKARILPAILRGELHFSIGYTEPEAGTDLASLKTTAARDGDHYIVNGTKVFTSLVDHADYVWLAARTDLSAPKHKGISILMVDTKSPGFKMAPTETLGDNRCATTYYENVRVPVANLVGKEHGGWRLITTQLNHERVALMSAAPLGRLLEEVTAWAALNRRLELPWVQANLATVAAKQSVLRLFHWRQAYQLFAGGEVAPADASAMKVFGSELYVEAYRLLLEVLGQPGYLQRGSPGAVLKGRLERFYRALLVLTFGAGTNEIQRDIIATTGLGMPRSQS
jgi:alkylation response protein AidB-like acyl-CoA dehydrogenase